MSAPEDPIGGLPDALRESNRPIVIYQTVQPNAADQLNNSLGLLSWLALVSLCIGLVAFCFWRVWNPNHDPAQFSPIYAEGRPLGLAKQIDERRQINGQAAGLMDYLDRIRSDTRDRRRTSASHPLVTGRGGIDSLREEWDGMCRAIREGVYDRRLGQIEVQIDELRRRRGLGGDPGEIARIDADLTNLVARRDAVIEQRRTDADPQLRCTPAGAAPACGSASDEPWCNPEMRLPKEFVEGPGDRAGDRRGDRAGGRP